MSVSAMKDRIEAKLNAALAPERLEVLDESHLHAGHAGARAGGETHYRVLVVSRAFEGRSRLDRHRRVNEILAQELNDRIHALAIRALAPDEDR